MKIQSNKSWYKAISNVNQIFYESSFNNPLTTIPPQQFFTKSSTSLPSPSLYRTERIFWKLRDATTPVEPIRSILESTKCTR